MQKQVLYWLWELCFNMTKRAGFLCFISVMWLYVTVGTGLSILMDTVPSMQTLLRSCICWERNWKSITVDFTRNIGSAPSCFSLLNCTEQLNQSVNLSLLFYGIWGRFSLEMSTQTNTQKIPTVIVAKIYPCSSNHPSGNQGS